MNKLSNNVDVKRAERINKAMKRVGVSVLATAYAITAWSIYKWASNGFIPNDRLDTFCGVTGESPKLVCDPSIAHLMKSGKVPKVKPNPTKGREFVKKSV